MTCLWIYWLWHIWLNTWHILNVLLLPTDLTHYRYSFPFSFLPVSVQRMARSGCCAAQSTCEKRSEEGSLKDRPSPWPVSSWTVCGKCEAEVLVSCIQCFHVLPQESSTSGSGSCSSQDTDMSVPGVLTSSNATPSKGNYNRTDISLVTEWVATLLQAGALSKLRPPRMNVEICLKKKLCLPRGYMTPPLLLSLM